MSSNSFEDRMREGLDDLQNATPFQNPTPGTPLSSALRATDPLGLDWEWLDNEKPTVEPSNGIVPSGGSRSRPRRLSWLAASLAACLLLGLGVMLATLATSWRNSITVAYDTRTITELGGGQSVAIRASNRSTQPVYLHFVGLRPANPPIHSESNRELFRLRPGETQEYELPDVFGQLDTVFVIATTTPAGDAVAALLRKSSLPGGGEVNSAELKAGLSAMGYAYSEVSTVKLR